MTTRTTPEVPAVLAGAPGPAPYGLTPGEARAELRRLAAAGWQLWEIHRRFGNPRQWQTATPPRTARRR
ncbi:hypothetical protein GCM10010495_17980 [Kitasatospora herbaricolor]|uniref:hypothetical protein n=1 Tax=Kitasatospora herbaricolor TaxID=68217 RepID=UPI00174E79E1|nr:hypothetical protein [Kitasatospora herbaricolor]MDQ0308246.1 hypothetical protein [Kitasatospora herbaricolor]GGV06263.1 hypothetical protein GCM10010495_17980 [Kitasatospora herbaricolor]